MSAETVPNLGVVGDKVKETADRLYKWQLKLRHDKELVGITLSHMVHSPALVDLGTEPSPWAGYEVHLREDFPEAETAKKESIIWFIRADKSSPQPVQAALRYEFQHYSELRGVDLEWLPGERPVLFESFHQPAPYTFLLQRAVMPGELFPAPSSGDPGRRSHQNIDDFMMDSGLLLERAKGVLGAQYLEMEFNFRGNRFRNWRAVLGFADSRLMQASYNNGVITGVNGSLESGLGPGQPYYLQQRKRFLLPSTLNPVPHLESFGRAKVEFDVMS